jgi:hypothetical protein
MKFAHWVSPLRESSALSAAACFILFSATRAGGEAMWLAGASGVAGLSLTIGKVQVKPGKIAEEGASGQLESDLFALFMNLPSCFAGPQGPESKPSNQSP